MKRIVTRHKSSLVGFPPCLMSDATILAIFHNLRSPYWIAPEVIEMKGAGPESDVWSLGATVVELITGSPPFFELPPLSAMFHIVADEVIPLPSGISPALHGERRNGAQLSVCCWQCASSECNRLLNSILPLRWKPLQIS